MKKTLVFLGIAILALAACNKSQTVVAPESPAEISFNAVANKATKAWTNHEIEGLLPDDTWFIHASASTKEQLKYFTDKKFKATVATPIASTEYRNWEADDWAPIYWPLGGAPVDYLAYAAKDAAVTAISPSFSDATVAAKTLTIADWDTYANQYDVVYAAANNVESRDAVALSLKHAQAVIAFTAVRSSNLAFKITKIEVLDLGYQGTFTVDNSKTALEASWGTLTTGVKEIKGADFAYTVTTSVAQVGDHLLVPQQISRQFKLYYKMGADDTTIYTQIINPERKVWEMGKLYTYALSFEPQEIKFTESVADWDDVAAETVTLD